MKQKSTKSDVFYDFCQNVQEEGSENVLFPGISDVYIDPVQFSGSRQCGAV